MEKDWTTYIPPGATNGLSISVTYRADRDEHSLFIVHRAGSISLHLDRFQAPLLAQALRRRADTLPWMRGMESAG